MNDEIHAKLVEQMRQVFDTPCLRCTKPLGECQCTEAELDAWYENFNTTIVYTSKERHT